MNDPLFQAICSDPDNVQLRLVYADYLEDQGDPRADFIRVQCQLAEMEEVDYVVITAGSFDLLIEVVCADDASLLEILNERIRAIPAIRSTETFMYLRLVKQTYAWGAK